MHDMMLVSAIASKQQAAELYNGAQIITYSLLGGVIAGGALLALWVARSIASPLQDAMQMAQRIAGGDLGTRIPPQPSNQAGKLLQAMQMNDSLLAYRQVQSGAHAIGDAASDIAAGNQDLSSHRAAGVGAGRDGVLDGAVDSPPQNAEHAWRPTGWPCRRPPLPSAAAATWRRWWNDGLDQRELEEDCRNHRRD
jgi:methyl-accepting chemotaxis protein